MKIALVSEGVVTNIIVAGEGYTPPDGMTAVPVAAGCVVGSAWDGETFTPPEPPEQPTPTPTDYPLKRWQFKAMVAYLGIEAAIEGAIEVAFPDALPRAVVLARYRESDVYNRNDPLFAQLAPAVGLTSEQLDAAWMAIATA